MGFMVQIIIVKPLCQGLQTAMLLTYTNLYILTTQTRPVSSLLLPKLPTLSLVAVSEAGGFGTAARPRGTGSGPGAPTRTTSGPVAGATRTV